MGVGLKDMAARVGVIIIDQVFVYAKSKKTKYFTSLERVNLMNNDLFMNFSIHRLLRSPIQGG